MSWLSGVLHSAGFSRSPVEIDPHHWNCGIRTRGICDCAEAQSPPSHPHRVQLESPYAGNVGMNVRYARACVRDSLMRGESPIASHLLYTQLGILDDLIPEQRQLGINAGHAWMGVADLIAVYTDLGISRGMRLAIERACFSRLPIEYRSLQP